MTVEGKGHSFYAYVGGMGTRELDSMRHLIGGYNGGAGGGATDLRIDNNGPDDRIIVAASGGCTLSYLSNSHYVAPGGDLFGRCINSKNKVELSEKTNQKNGHKTVIGSGQDGTKFLKTVVGSGAEGGWFGWVSNSDSSNIKYYLSAGEGGSSYASGYEGCDINDKMIFENATLEADNHEGDGLFVLTILQRCSENCEECNENNICLKCHLNSYIENGECKECHDGIDCFWPPTHVFSISQGFSYSSKFSPSTDFYILCKIFSNCIFHLV